VDGSGIARLLVTTVRQRVAFKGLVQVGLDLVGDLLELWFLLAYLMSLPMSPVQT
jgi:hypothetical protein